MSRRSHSLLYSYRGSSFRSEPDLDDADRPSPRGNRDIMDLLKLLPSNDRTFDNLSETSGDGELSVASHPFSEDTPRFEDAEKHFSSVYQEVMAGLKPPRPDSVCSTCTSCDTCSTDTWDALGIDEAKIQRVAPQPLPAPLERQLQDQLNQLTVERPKKRRRREKCDSASTEQQRHRSALTKSEPDNMSGLWNMLATYDEFVITPPGFNVYQQDKPHWLDQEPIPWEQRERARRKCVKWLNSYHL